MQPGNLVRLVQSKKHFATWTCWEGEVGIIASHYDHPSSTWGEWFTVLVDGAPRNMREDYLEVLNEAR